VQLDDMFRADGEDDATAVRVLAQLPALQSVSTRDLCDGRPPHLRAPAQSGILGGVTNGR
jgi:hypothetical protein